MTDSTTTGNSASTANPESKVDVQDPLPETDWFWRRAYSYVLTIALLVAVWLVLVALEKGGDTRALYDIGVRLVYLLALVSTYYLIAPSAEQIVRMIQASRILQAGVPITRTATAETADGTITTARTVAGATDPPQQQSTMTDRAPPPQAVPGDDDVAPRSKA